MNGGGIMSLTLKQCVKILAIAVVVVSVVSIVGPAGTVHAGVIAAGPYTGSGPGGTGTGTVGATLGINNDNVNPGLNTASLSMTFTAIGAIDYVFPVASSSGITEYFFNSIVTTNTTGQTWTGFTFRLGSSGSGKFVPFTTGTLDFDDPNKDPGPTSIAFSTLSHQPYQINWSGGTGVTSPGTNTFTLSIDVPDGLANFTLRSEPTVPKNAPVPEPATLLLVGSGLVSLGVFGRKRLAGRRGH
jgi:PEP-CTERM motif-containing protein